ncbi:MAG: Ig-like domain-containing protein [Patescibacteria group bacterium]|jgi:hypothetical protein
MLKKTSRVQKISFKILTFAVVFSTLLWSSGAALPLPAQAAVTATAAGDVTAVYGTAIAPTDSPIPLAFALTQSAAETLNAVTFTVTGVTGGGFSAATANDFNSDPDVGPGPIGAAIIRDVDTPAGDVMSLKDDAESGFLGGIPGSSINIGTPTTITFDPVATIPANMTGRGTYEYYLVFVLSATAVNNHAFTVTFAAGAGNAFTLSSGTVSVGAAPVTSAAIHVDAAPPAATGSGGPLEGQQYVPVDALVNRVFTKALASSTVTTSNVTLKLCNAADQTSAAAACASLAATNLCDTVDLPSTTNVRCSHINPLTVNKWYQFTIGTGVTSDAGAIALASAVVSRFKTAEFDGGAGGSNGTPPQVVNSYPQGGQNNVPTNAKLTFSFSKGPEGNMTEAVAISPANITLMKITSGAPGADLCTSAGTCTNTWDSTNRILKVVPIPALTANSEYVMMIQSMTNVAGVALPGAFMARFNTGAGADSTGPALRTTGPTSPATGATGVSKYLSEAVVYFSEDIDPSTLALETSIGLYPDANDNGAQDGGENMLSATTALAMNYDQTAKAARLGLKAAFSASTKYCFKITNAVKDVVGNAATASANQCFTTGNDTDITAPKLIFAEADNYKLVARFSEPVVYSLAVDLLDYSLQCPVGVNANLALKPISYRTDTKEVEIRQLGLATGQQCRLIVSGITDLAGNAFATTPDDRADFKILNAETTGGNLGGGGATDFNSGTDFGDFWENPERCQPKVNVAGKTGQIDCEFPAPAALASGSKFILTFPDGFNVASVATIAATSSWLNNDINGSAANGPKIASVAVDNTAKTVTVTTGTAAIASGDQIHFELKDLVNPALPAEAQRVSIVVKDADGIKVGQTINAAPFNIQTGGAYAISGTVCKGSTSGGTCGGGDTGVENVRVFCDSMGGFGAGAIMAGHQEALTDASGDWSITGLSAGQYGCGLPGGQTTLADLGGGGGSMNLTIAGASKTDIDFKYADLSSTGKTLTINITSSAALSGEKVDVFCSAGGFDASFSAPVMKLVTLDGSGAGSTTLKLQPGKTYTCGVGPHIPFDSMGGGGPTVMPDFKFMPPRPTDVVVPTGSNPTALTYNLIVAGNSITGFVKDGSNTGIANVYVNAMPLGCFDASTGEAKECFGGFSQTKSDGSFSLNVAPGTYMLGASGPGLPTSGEQEVTVLTDGTLKQRGSTVASITLKLAKSSLTISGMVQDESGNGIKYAQVSAEKISSGQTCANGTPAGYHADSPTDASGNYTLYVAAGTYCVRAFAPSYGEVGNKTVVISDAASSGQNIQATAADFGTISGTVTKNSVATSGAFVVCYGPSGANNTQSNTDGSYSIKVKAGSGYTCEGNIAGAGPLTPVDGITVAAAGTSVANLTMGNPGTVNITMTGLTDGFVDLRTTAGQGNSTGLNNAGVYTIKVPAGVYTVRGGGPKYGELCAGQTVTVTAGGTHAVTCTPPSNLRTVAGRVTDGTANLAGVTVVLNSSSTGRSIFATTDAQSGSNNNLNLTNVPEGTYNILASKQGFEPATASATISGGNLTISTPIALTQATGANGTSSTVTVQLSGSAYTGNAKVVATKDSKVVMAPTDKTNGQATLYLTNGAWTVVAYGDNGKKSAAGTITVTAGSASGTTTYSLTTDITGYTPATDTGTMVPSTGGLLKSDEISGLELNIPGSTLSTSDANTGKVDMTLDPTLAVDPGADMNFIGTSGFDITPKDSNGNEIGKSLVGDAATLTLPYTDADVLAAGVDETKLTCGSLDDSTGLWETFPTTVDTTNNTITCQITHFSSFGVLGSISAAGGSGGDHTAPAVVGSATATAGVSKIVLTWTDSPDGDLSSIDILRNNGGATPVNGVVYSAVQKGIQTYTDTNVQAGVSYTYIIRAKDNAGNYANSAEISATPTAAVNNNNNNNGGGGGGAAPATPATPATPAVPTVSPAVPATPATPATPASASTTADPDNLEEVLAAVNAVRDETAEAKYTKLITADVKEFKLTATAEGKTPLTTFVVYGISDATKKLGAGERRALLRDYLETVGRTDVVWSDVELMANGQKPVKRNLAKEQAQVTKVLATFKTLVGHNPNFQNPAEDLAWNTLMYRIRFSRDLVKEKAGIVEFKAKFGKVPTTPLGWAAVRAAGYALGQ